MITQSYIKMCEQADEIQKAWKPKLLDKVITKRTLTNNNYSQNAVGYIEDFEHPYDEYYYKNYGYIYLPTQEQLQEMVKGKVFHIWGTFDSLDLAVASIDRKKRDSHKVCNKIKSFNELWLAFVMHEKYNKIWIGEKWILKEGV